jgi:hypothetical protein
MGRGVRKALLGPVNLGVVGAAAVGAAAMGSAALAVLGGAAYAALVAWDLSSPSFWRKVMGTAPAPGPQLPSPRDVADHETREALERVQRAREAIAAVATPPGGALASPQQEMIRRVDELGRRVTRLVARSDELSRYLAETDGEALQAELERLDERARTAPDAEARGHYQEAAAAQKDRLRTLADIAAARERLLANLARIVATLEGIPDKLVKMRALDASDADDLTGSVGHDLDEMNLELKSFEETLQSLVEERA